MSHPVEGNINTYYHNLNYGIIANQDLKASLLIDNNSQKYFHLRQQEQTQMVAELTNRLASSWRQAIVYNRHCRDFNGILVRVSELVASKISASLAAMPEYINEKQTLLTHLNWPEKTKTKGILDFLDEDDDLATDN